jgi:hypothetical protein
MLSNTQENENQSILTPEEIKNEEIKEEEIKNEEIKNEELKPQETKEEDNATKISETLDSLSIDIETKNNKKNIFQKLFSLFIRPCSSS